MWHLEGIMFKRKGKKKHELGRQEDLDLRTEMATHCSILAWRIPWTYKPGKPSPWGHRVEHDWTTNTPTYNQGKLRPLRLALRVCQIEALMAKAVIQSLTPLRQKLYYHHKSQTLKGERVGCGRNLKYHSYRTCQVSSISAFKTPEMGKGMMGP